MSREFEIKYRLTAPAFEGLVEKFGPFHATQMETTYYDTPQGTLSSRHWTLRRRLENGVSVCTLKTPAVNGGRGEWEVPAQGIDAEGLIAAGAPEELAELIAPGLVPICGARFTRLAADIQFLGSRLELALDRGKVLGGGLEGPIYEVEAELKNGTDQDCVAFGLWLKDTYGLEPEPKSKFKRAKALAQERR